jgi:alpha-tubulin suppressor-like RCC1 family protein
VTDTVTATATVTVTVTVTATATVTAAAAVTAAVTVTAAVLLGACGAGGDGAGLIDAAGDPIVDAASTDAALPADAALPVDAPRPAVRIAIEPAELPLDAVGAIGTLAIAAFDELGQRVPAPAVAWRTTNRAVFAIDGGAVTATGEGAALVVADGAGLSASGRIIVARVLPPGAGLAATAIAAGGRHTCALTGNGVLCWGATARGAVGDGTVGGDPPYAAEPRRVTGTQRFAALGAGSAHSCAIATGGDAWCWGDNQHGQRGVPEPAASGEPVAVATSLQLSSIAAGAGHTCAIRFGTQSGYCWGDHARGQLGTGDGGGGPDVVAVSGERAWGALGAGVASTCGVTTSGVAWCWGDNRRGQLGRGEPAGSNQPVRVAGDRIYAGLAVGGEHACARTAVGAVWCWGANDRGQLGADSSDDERGVPVAVAGELALSGLTAGARHTCGLAADGAAWCWGSNQHGQLGDLSTMDARRPVAVAGGLAFAALAAGEAHTCGVTRAGATFCWGADDDGQLGAGRGGAGDLSIVPWPVATPAGP